MLFALLLLIHQASSDCIENSFLSFPKQAEWVYAVKRISIKLEGEYIIGYGDEYEVKDKTKIQIKQVPSGLTFGPSEFEIFCPGIHQLSKKDTVKCEIQLDMKEINATATPAKAKFIIPVEQDNEIKENPVFQIESNFQMRLMDLAKQLEKMAYYLEYENCDTLVYLLPKPLPISADQIVLLQKYSTALPEGSPISEIAESNKGELYVENFSIDSSSSTHLYGLIAIVIGVVLLAVIRTFSKKKEQQNNAEQQPLNQQELIKLS